MLLLVLVPKERLIVNVFDRMVVQEVLLTTLTEAVPVNVLAVVSTVSVPETVTVIPSNEMV